MNTAVKERPAAKAKKDEPHKILMKDLRLAEHARAHFDVTLPDGVPFEASLDPRFWTNVAHLLARQPGGHDDMTGALINISPEDHSYLAVLFVRAVRKQALDVAVWIPPVPFGPQGDVSTEDYSVKWNAKERGFDIIRSGGAIVGRAQDFKKKEQALAWIASMKG